MNDKKLFGLDQKPGKEAFQQPKILTGAMFEEWFPWESEEQKKGYYALQKFIKDTITKRPELGCAVEPMITCWFIQKDHESNLWWQEVLGTQIKALQEEIVLLKNQVENFNKGGQS